MPLDVALIDGPPPTFRAWRLVDEFEKIAPHMVTMIFHAGRYSSSFSHIEGREKGRWVVAYLEGLYQTQLESIGSQQSKFRSLTDANGLGQRARSPVCRILGLFLLNLLDDETLMLLSLSSMAPTAGQVILKGGQAATEKSSLPTPDRTFHHTKALGYFLILFASGCQQHDLCALHYPCTRATASSPFQPGFTFCHSEFNLRGYLDGSHFLDRSPYIENTYNLQ